MMGNTIDGPAYIFGDNKSILCNTTIPYSTLKKKLQCSAHHLVREGAAIDEWRTEYMNMHVNPATF